MAGRVKKVIGAVKGGVQKAKDVVTGEAKYQKNKAEFVRKAKAAKEGEVALQNLKQNGISGMKVQSGEVHNVAGAAIGAIDDFGALTKDHVQIAYDATRKADDRINLAEPGDTAYRPSHVTMLLHRRLSSFQDGHDNAKR